MRDGYAWRMSVSVALVLIALFGNASYFTFLTSPPVWLTVADAHTLVVHPREDLPLPAPLVDGDRVDVGALDADARMSLAIDYELGRLPLGHPFTLALERSGSTLAVPVTIVPFKLGGWTLFSSVVSTFTTSLLGLLTLLLVWRGHDRAAVGMAIWAGAYLIGIVGGLPVQGTGGVLLDAFQQLCYVGARVGFYLMADALVARSFASRTRLYFGLVFAVLLVGGSAPHVLGPLVFAFAGDATYLRPEYQLVYSWVYAVPALMLALSYGQAPAPERIRLRWAIASAVTLMASVTLTNTIAPGLLIAQVTATFLFMLPFVGMAYALLRHRVVDVSIVIDRALVYGLVTTLVVGVVAAVNSVVLREALPPGAGLALQVIVPLALGIVLGRVRAYLDRFVERVFFRRKYLSEKALKAFARHAGHVGSIPKLLDAAVREIARHTGTPALAIYSAEAGDWRRLAQSDGAGFPEALDGDDAALVAVRAELKPVELGVLASALGRDGCLFPMRVLGNLRGAVVLRNRPGENYGSDEKRLIAQVAREVGAAWRILRARENEALVVAMAAGAVAPKAAFAEAKRLSRAWASSPAT